MPDLETEMQQTSRTNSPHAPFKLAVDQLKRDSHPETLGFNSTDELPDLQDVIGQPRALRALELGSEVTGIGYNIFVLGTPGSGRTTLTQEYLQRKAAREQIPDDWCYVNNFENPRSPRLLRLPTGRGAELRKDMQTLVQFCERELPGAFESKEYLEERNRLAEELQSKQESVFTRLQQHADKYSFVVGRTPFGVVLVPAVEGKPLKPEDIEKLSDEQRSKLNELQARLGEEVEKSLGTLRELANRMAEDMEQLNIQTATFVVSPMLEEIQKRFSDLEPVQSYLSAVKEDILANISRFQPRQGDGQPTLPSSAAAGQNWMRRYEVNVLIDNSELKGAPVVVESHPVYANLTGRIEHEVFMGASHTDFTLIRPGAFHRANGGYLVLPARDLLLNPYSWEGVKRLLRDGCIRIIELGTQVGLVSSETLEPEPIPLDLKVILVGTPMLYYLLQMHDEDFSKLFKVRAEFASTMERTLDSEREYGLFAKSVVVDNQLPAFDARAVARIIEHSARLAEDQDKLSTRFGMVADLMREAAYWARKEAEHPEKVKSVSGEAVQRAIREAKYRNSLVDERLQELVKQGTIMIDVTGTRVGSINGLSVIQLGEYAFGRPTRLTVVVSPGKSGVIDIEREAKLGGPIHTKGVLILSGFLNSRYGHSGPLNLSASLTFEQSYSEVEGDSASAAELFALLSAIAQVPLRQDIAVTGSINQHGAIQAIGGVNEKIEGFFAACQARGLTGTQGVAIPASNQRNLMLEDEVVEAVRNGSFHIWTMETVEDGMALLSGLEAGEKLADGSYPGGSLNEKICERLEAFATALEKQNGTADKEEPSTTGD